MNRSFGWLVSRLNSLASIWICILMLIITADVLARNVLGRPIQGVTEIVKLSVVTMTWLMIPYTLRSGGHLRSNLILKAMPSWGRKAVLVLNSAAGAILMAIVAWLALLESGEMFRLGAYEGISPVRIPLWPVWALLTLGATLAAIQFLLDAIRIMLHGPSEVDDAGSSAITE